MKKIEKDYKEVNEKNSFELFYQIITIKSFINCFIVIWKSPKITLKSYKVIIYFKERSNIFSHHYKDGTVETAKCKSKQIKRNSRSRKQPFKL